MTIFLGFLGVFIALNVLTTILIFKEDQEWKRKLWMIGIGLFIGSLVVGGLGYLGRRIDL